MGCFKQTRSRGVARVFAHRPFKVISCLAVARQAKGRLTRPGEGALFPSVEFQGIAELLQRGSKILGLEEKLASPDVKRGISGKLGDERDELRLGLSLFALAQQKLRQLEPCVAPLLIRLRLPDAVNGVVEIALRVINVALPRGQSPHLQVDRPISW